VIDNNEIENEGHPVEIDRVLMREGGGALYRGYMKLIPLWGGVSDIKWYLYIHLCVKI